MKVFRGLSICMVFFGLLLLMPQLSSSKDSDPEARKIAEGQDAPGALVDSAGNLKAAKETVDLFMFAMERDDDNGGRFVADCVVALDMNEYPPNNVVMDLTDSDSFDIHGPCEPTPPEEDGVEGEDVCTAELFECCISVKTTHSGTPHSCTLPFVGLDLAGEGENEDEFGRDWAIYGCDSRDASELGCGTCLDAIHDQHSQGQFDHATFYLRDVRVSGACGWVSDDTIRIGGPFDFETKD